MANPEHLAILEQGVEKWNQWRNENFEIKPDLQNAHICQVDLRGINLSDVNLRGAKFHDVDLSEANLNRADLYKAFLAFMVFDGDDEPTHVTLSKANLRGTNFSGANLRGADITEANLSETDFSGADLTEANFSGAILSETNLAGSHIRQTIFGNVNLSQAKGLEFVVHEGPSVVEINSIKEGIPEAFLRGCGVPEQFITGIAGQASQYHSCFISYSSKDQAFAERLYADLQSKGVRCWFAPEDLKIGDKWRVRIDESILKHEKLLLVLSNNSIASDWVEKEVETAMEKEHESNSLVLFPVRLDDSVNAIKSGWAADVRRTRHIGDFCNWKSRGDYGKAFERLLRDLKVGA